MKPKDYFMLGCKLFGVYCFVLGIPLLVTTIPSFIQPASLDEEYRKIYMATVVTARIIPFVYIIGGLYLIRGGESLYNFAYPASEEYAENIAEKFLLFLKLLGTFLIVSYFPNLLRTISSYFVYSNAPSVYNMLQEQQVTYLNAASSLWGVLVGVYLLVGGKFIVRFGLKAFQKSSTENIDNN